MLILFSLIVMRMSGAIYFSPIFGRTNVPGRVKAALIFVFSLLLYTTGRGMLDRQPGSMIEYGAMLLGELLFGLSISFAMELAFLVVRFASAVMDFCMGLSMAQIYDPQYNTQMTVTSGLFYTFLLLLFFALDGHIWLVRIFFVSADQIPYGTVSFDFRLPGAILSMFSEAILMGTKFALPLVAMELVTEAAVGILMKIIPQINVFVVNFQIKLIVGILMLLLMFGPMSDQLYRIIEFMTGSIENIITLMG